VSQDRRQQVREVLTSGPMTTRGIVRQILGITTMEPLPREVIAQVTQALLALERAGEVMRTSLAGGLTDWQLRLPPGPAGGD